MIHWNAELRRELKAQGYSPFSIYMKTAFEGEHYGASSLGDFLQHKHTIIPPATTLLGELLNGQHVYVEFPWLKYEKIDDLSGIVMDPTGEVTVLLSDLWENSGIHPDQIPNGGRLESPFLAYAPKRDEHSLIHFHNPLLPASKKSEQYEKFLSFET